MRNRAVKTILTAGVAVAALLYWNCLHGFSSFGAGIPVEGQAEFGDDMGVLSPELPATETAQMATPAQLPFHRDAYIDESGYTHHYVGDAASLRNVIETTDGLAGNGTWKDHIHLTADIKLDKTITAPTSQPGSYDSVGKEIIIDGGGETGSAGDRYRLEHNASVSGGNGGGIGTNLIGTENTVITLRNLVAVGYNYYGMVTSHHSANGYYWNGYPDVAINFENVQFTGPQLAHNINRGVVTVTDCDIRIQYHAGGNAAQEIAEFTWMRFRGSNTISHATTDTSGSFWPQNPENRPVAIDNRPGIIVEDGVTTIRSNTFFMFTVAGAEYAREQDPQLTIEENAALHYQSPGGGGKAYVNGALGLVTLRQNAVFRLVNTLDTWTAGHAYLTIQGGLKMEKGSVFEYSSYRPEGYLELSAAKSAHFANVTIDLDQPARFSAAGKLRAIKQDATVSWQVRGVNAVNAWYYAKDQNHPDIAGALADSIDNLPDRIWHYTGADFPAAFNMAIGGGERPAIAIDGAGADLVDVLHPSEGYALADTLALGSTTLKRLVIGDFTLAMDPVSPASPEASGRTHPNATMRVTYINRNTDAVTVSGSADDQGRYSFPLADALADQEIAVLAHSDMLKVHPSIRLQGGVQLAVDSLYFGSHPLPDKPTWYPRPDDWRLVVTDTRRDSSAPPWRLYLSATAMQSESGAALPNALYFAGLPIGAEPQQVFSHAADDDITTVNLNDPASGGWQPEEGLLLKAGPADTSIGQYRAALHWQVVYAP